MAMPVTMKMSASAMSSLRISLPSSLFRRRAMLRQLRRSPSHCQFGVPRVKSGMSAFSTQMTSAPYSPMMVAMNGPAKELEALTTFKSDKVPNSGLLWFFHMTPPKVGVARCRRSPGERLARRS